MEILEPLRGFSGLELSGGDSVTIVIRCRVQPAQREEFLCDLKAVLAEFSQAAGAVGSHVFEQEQGGETLVTIMQRFTSSRDHQAWLQSDAFLRWQEKISPEGGVPREVSRYYGVEALFAGAPGLPAATPPRWKLAAVLVLAAFPSSYALSKWCGPLLASIPPFFAALITTPIMVLLMTYVMVPLLTRVFSRWLTPSP